jgi:GNAT superfamily N-acetyltransferase
MTPSAVDVIYRRATESDSVGIATLHAESWRTNYRGAYLDSYLDGNILPERLEVWSDRLVHDDPANHTLVAEIEGQVCGFAHVIFDHDPTWGALLDNLHVAHHLKRLGVGRQLLGRSALAVIDSNPSKSMHLWVLRQNTPAQAFYQSQGGACRGEEMCGPFPGGGTAAGFRYVWPPSALLRLQWANG